MSYVKNLNVNSTSYDIKSVAVNDVNSGGAYKSWFGVSSAYTQVNPKDSNTLYYVTDSQEVYLGSTLISNYSTSGDALPDQTGNAGKLLTTNGTAASWQATGVIVPVVETYSNNGSWYRIWAPDDTGYRYCEQGGLVWQGTTMAATDNTINFPKAFIDLTYNFMMFSLHSTANLTANVCPYEKYTSRTTSSTVLRIVGAVFGYEWRACGYIADEAS